jgi:hypothetical protein
MKIIFNLDALLSICFSGQGRPSWLILSVSPLRFIYCNTLKFMNLSNSFEFKINLEFKSKIQIEQFINSKSSLFNQASSFTPQPIRPPAQATLLALAHLPSPVFTRASPAHLILPFLCSARRLTAPALARPDAITLRQCPSPSPHLSSPSPRSTPESPWSCPYTEPSWSHGTHLAAHAAPEHRS